MAEGPNLHTSADDQVPGRIATDKLCDPCKKRTKEISAIVYCINCEQYQCEKCKTAHDVLYSIEHNLVDVTQAPKQTFGQEIKALDICQEHGEVFKFFCVDHDVLCCSTCAFEMHRKCHEVNTINTQITHSGVTEGELKLKLDRKMTHFSSLKSSLSNVMEDVQEARSKVTGQIEELPKTIEDIKENVNNIFDNLKIKLQTDAETAELDIANELDEKQSKGNDILNVLEKTMEKGKLIAASGSMEQLFIAVHSMEKTKASVSEAVKREKQTNIYTLDLRVEYCPELSAFLKLGSEIAFLKQVKRKVKRSLKLDSERVNLELIVQKDIKIEDGDNAEPLYTGMSFLPDGRLVVIDNHNRKCLLMNDKLDIVGKYKFSFVPNCVVTISNMEVAVTGAIADIMAFLSINGDNDIAFRRSVLTDKKCQSISVLDDSMFVVSSMEDKIPVRKMNFAGKCSDLEVEFITNEEFDSDDTASAFAQESDTLVFTDRNNNRVFVHDTGNDTNKQHVLKHRNIKQPKGVCIAPNGSIFLCSSKLHSIVQLATVGKVISTVKIGMCSPRTICVSNDGCRLAVSNDIYGEGSLQIYAIT